jgi:biotin operon repressor
MGRITNMQMDNLLSSKRDKRVLSDDGEQTVSLSFDIKKTEVKKVVAVLKKMGVDISLPF